MSGLRERLIRIVLITTAVTVAAVVLVTVIFSFAQGRWSFDQVTSNLEKPLANQIQELAASFLIPEQGAGRALLLEKYKATEGLVSALVLTPSENLPEFLADCQRSSNPTRCKSRDGKLAVVVAPIVASDLQFGHFVKLKVNSSQEAVWIFRYGVAAFLAVLMAIVTIVILMSRLYNQVSKSISALEHWTGQVALGADVDDKAPDFRFREFQHLAQNIKRLIDEGSEFKKQSLGSEIAKQVAHDIRSPVHAITIVVDCLRASEISAEDKNALSSAANRINEIANILLSKQWAKGKNHARKASAETADLGSAIEVIVNEKRLQIKDRPHVLLKSNVTQGLSLCAKVDSVEIKRALSNLITNGIEALHESGFVEVKVKAEGLKAKIEIIDNGCGIPKAIQSRLGERGLTFGRHNGSGLGVYHAVKTIGASGGSINFASIEGQGTTVEITLPLDPARHSASEITSVKLTSQVVVIDDDPAIHRFWELNVEKHSSVTGRKVDLLHFHSYDDAKRWIKVSRPNTDRLFLVDYELSELGPTGLDLVEELKIATQSVLVSSRADDEAVRLRANKIGIRVLSKDRAASLFGAEIKKAVNL